MTVIAIGRSPPRCCSSSFSPPFSSDRAWIVVITMPLVILLLTAIRRHHDGHRSRADPQVARRDAAPTGSTSSCSPPSSTARGCRRWRTPMPPARNTLTAITVRTSYRETETTAPRLVRVRRPGAADDPGVVLPRGQPTGDRPHQALPPPEPVNVVAVCNAGRSSATGWEHFLHNQSELRLKTRLLYQPGLLVTHTSLPAGIRPIRLPQRALTRSRRHGEPRACLLGGWRNGLAGGPTGAKERA